MTDIQTDSQALKNHPFQINVKLYMLITLTTICTSSVVNSMIIHSIHYIVINLVRQ